jgi:hypothetical protein
MPAFDPQKESLFHICGDAPDPTGMTNLRGAQSSVDFTGGAFAHPMLRWRDRVVEADLYETDGQLMLHLLCPKCSTPEAPHALWVKQEQKPMEWDKERKLLSVAAFSCTWELPEGRRQEFGIGMCRWRVAIDKNVVREV